MLQAVAAEGLANTEGLRRLGKPHEEGLRGWARLRPPWGMPRAWFSVGHGDCE